MFTDTETEAFQVKTQVLPPSWLPHHALTPTLTLQVQPLLAVPCVSFQVIFCPCICILVYTQISESASA